MAALPSFTVVYIPTDVTEPLAEWSIPIPPGREVECLTSRLKEHYIATGPALSADAAARHASSLLEQAGTSAASVSDETLRAMAQMQLVESVPLLPGGASTNQTHVNLYVDDSGVAKNLPLNERACGLCAACGYVSLPILEGAQNNPLPRSGTTSVPMHPYHTGSKAHIRAQVRHRRNGTTMCGRHENPN